MIEQPVIGCSNMYFMIINPIDWATIDTITNTPTSCIDDVLDVNMKMTIKYAQEMRAINVK